MNTRRRPIVFRPNAAEIAEEVARAKEITSQALELLKQSPPDTFLGRKHDEPIPLLHEEE
jgi:hypothetical protein